MRSVSLPVASQQAQKAGGQYQLAVPGTFTLADMQYLAVTINIPDAQVDQLTDPQACSVTGGEHCLLFAIAAMGHNQLYLAL